MAPKRLVFPGIVKGGVAVPQHEMYLPEGIRVEIHVQPADMTPELESEMDQWDKVCAEAWAMIDKWEAESP